MVLAIILLTCQLGSEGAFSQFVSEVNKVALEHSTAVNARDSDAGKEEITQKNNERLQELVAKEMVARISFEYRIQSLDRNAEGDYSVVLEPSDPIAKADFVKRRSLTIPIQNNLGETLFTGDLLAFSGMLKTGASPRSKKAIPFALVRPEGLKQIAIWIDEIEIGKTKPKFKEEKESISNVVTPKMFITEIDRVFKEARSEVARGKTTADRQDIADKHTARLLEVIQAYDGSVFEFEKTITDVKHGDLEGEFSVTSVHSEPYRSFRSANDVALQILDSQVLTIKEMDRKDFVVGRRLIFRGRVSVSEKSFGHGSSGYRFAIVRLSSSLVAMEKAKIASTELFFSLEDMTTEFLLRKSNPKSLKK